MITWVILRAQRCAKVNKIGGRGLKVHSKHPEIHLGDLILILPAFQALIVLVESAAISMYVCPHCFWNFF